MTEMAAAMDGGVRFEVGDDAVGCVTLQRPDKLNAMDAAVFAGLRRAGEEAREAAAAGRCRAVLVAGAGRAFSAGMDVDALAAQATGAPPGAPDIAAMQDTFTVFEDLAVPTVAAVHGVALGAGCQLALACHLRVGAADARLGLLEARWALVPDLGATWRLPRLIGLSRATELAVTGRIVDAATALGWGLLDAVLPDEASGVPAGFASAARAYTARLASGPTVAVGAVPALLRASLQHDRATVLAAERSAQARCLRSDDFAEAAAAVRQRREPRFRGR